jgi:hypothetical protein
MTMKVMMSRLSVFARALAASLPSCRGATSAFRRASNFLSSLDSSWATTTLKLLARAKVSRLLTVAATASPRSSGTVSAAVPAPTMSGSTTAPLPPACVSSHHARKRATRDACSAPG